MDITDLFLEIEFYHNRSISNAVPAKISKFRRRRMKKRAKRLVVRPEIKEKERSEPMALAPRTGVNDNSGTSLPPEMVDDEAEKLSDVPPSNCSSLLPIRNKKKKKMEEADLNWR